MVPVLKFIGNPLIMKEFSINGFPFLFAAFFGIGLFSMNFALIFLDDTSGVEWYSWLIIAVLIIAYVLILYKLIREPISELIPLTKEEIEDHEYEQIVVDDTDSMSIDEDQRRNFSRSERLKAHNHLM